MEDVGFLPLWPRRPSPGRGTGGDRARRRDGPGRRRARSRDAIATSRARYAFSRTPRAPRGGRALRRGARMQSEAVYSGPCCAHQSVEGVAPRLARASRSPRGRVRACGRTPPHRRPDVDAGPARGARGNPGGAPRPHRGEAGAPRSERRRTVVVARTRRDDLLANSIRHSSRALTIVALSPTSPRGFRSRASPTSRRAPVLPLALERRASLIVAPPRDSISTHAANTPTYVSEYRCILATPP